jgi:hypothetical protein
MHDTGRSDEFFRQFITIHVNETQNLVSMKEHGISLWHCVSRYLRSERVGRPYKSASDRIVIKIGEKVIHQFEDNMQDYTTVEGDER